VSSIPNPSNHPPCPSWCDPRACTTTADDVQHRSLPGTVETEDTTWEMALGCTEELAHPEEWGRPPTLWLTAVSKCYAPSPRYPGDDAMTFICNLDYSELLHLTAAFNTYLSRFPLVDYAPSVRV
jgi:hypothetical protein